MSDFNPGETAYIVSSEYTDHGLSVGTRVVITGFMKGWYRVGRWDPYVNVWVNPCEISREPVEEEVG